MIGLWCTFCFAHPIRYLRNFISLFLSTSVVQTKLTSRVTTICRLFSPRPTTVRAFFFVARRFQPLLPRRLASNCSTGVSIVRARRYKLRSHSLVLIPWAERVSCSWLTPSICPTPTPFRRIRARVENELTFQKTAALFWYLLVCYLVAVLNTGIASLFKVKKKCTSTCLLTTPPRRIKKIYATPFSTI